MKIEFQPIGVIHTPFTVLESMPIQPAGGDGVQGTVDVFEEYRLLYHFHHSREYRTHVVPFLDSQPRGVFATRAPRRPNPIGLSVVRLNRIEGGVVHIENVDILDGTPLIDIKPYVPEFDAQDDVRAGWLEHVRTTVSQRKSDDRFKQEHE